MKETLALLTNIIIIAILITGIYFIVTAEVNEDSYDRKLEELKVENEELKLINDSLKQLLIEESFKYDSLMSSIDSSVDEYEKIEVRYKIIKDSVKYLPADESINFLHYKLNQYEMDNN